MKGRHWGSAHSQWWMGYCMINTLPRRSRENGFRLSKAAENRIKQFLRMWIREGQRTAVVMITAPTNVLCRIPKHPTSWYTHNLLLSRQTLMPVQPEGIDRIIKVLPRWALRTGLFWLSLKVLDESRKGVGIFLTRNTGNIRDQVMMALPTTSCGMWQGACASKNGPHKEMGT